MKKKLKGEAFYKNRRRDGGTSSHLWARQIRFGAKCATQTWNFLKKRESECNANVQPRQLKR